MGSYDRIANLLHQLNQKADRATHSADAETEEADRDAAGMERNQLEFAQLERIVHEAEALLRKFETLRSRHLKSRRSKSFSRPEPFSRSADPGLGKTKEAREPKGQSFFASHHQAEKISTT
jgi:hypothetical protein